MKIIYLVPIYLFILIINEPSINIKLGKLEKTYDVNNNISFRLINSDCTKYCCAISAEIYIDNSWIEMVNDITHPLRMETVCYNLPPKSTFFQDIPAKNLLFEDKPLINYWFRIKVNIFENNRIVAILHSNKFQVIK